MGYVIPKWALARWRREDAQPTTRLYFEAHVTIEPVYDERLAEVARIARGEGFRVADLLMKKRLADAPERSQFDTFCTGRSTSYDDLHVRMMALVVMLTAMGYSVWRYKIENTLLDVRLCGE